LILITDEKQEYRRALYAHRLFKHQDERHRIAHLSISSKLPRNFSNLLFSSNYLDREIRKDQANHHRESTCFSRNVSNAMARLLCYIVQHNYRKRYLIKSPIGDHRVHGEVAGIARSFIDDGLKSMLRERAFLSRLQLPPSLDRIWRKGFVTPGKPNPDRLPNYAFD
jgi:hypothetical protein